MLEWYPENRKDRDGQGVAHGNNAKTHATVPGIVNVEYRNLPLGDQPRRNRAGIRRVGESAYRGWNTMTCRRGTAPGPGVRGPILPEGFALRHPALPDGYCCTRILSDRLRGITDGAGKLRSQESVGEP